MSAPEALRIDGGRLLARLRRLGQIGALPGGGVARLALSDADKAGRDLVAGWMRELGLAVTVDAIGNIVGLRPGRCEAPPAMTGSHIDSVQGGGLYDGSYGVLAALEAVAALNEADIVTERPLAVAVFSNEEGVRFAPDMMGSLVHAGGLALEEALESRDAAGLRLGDELARIGYAGAALPGWPRPHAFVELHIEQGPVLQASGESIGAVQDLQGISWREFTFEGTANHAGTTPMGLRRDAGQAAARLTTRAREIAGEVPGQFATVGSIRLSPGLINVIAGEATLTVDLRNTDESRLRRAEAMLDEAVAEIAWREGVGVRQRVLARQQPVRFDAALVALIAETAARLGHSCRRMTSGAGHDAQMLARLCPAAMIFVPSAGGISHNPREHTDPAQLEAGANVLLQTLLRLTAD